MQESKEKIRSRMIKNASRLWGFQDTQAENSFDPLVGMILGALASELSSFSSEINSTEGRLLEKLVKLLTPEPVTGPFPSHALIRAKPVEPVFIINPLFRFFVNKKMTGSGEKGAIEKPVFFTPTGNYKLFSGQIKYMIAGAKIYLCQEELYKEVVAVAGSGKGYNTSEIWLGLEIDGDVESINGLSICFDLRNKAYENSFYDSLAKGRWTVNNQQAKFVRGTGFDNKGDGHTLENLLKNELDATSKICKHINQFYHKYFITISDVLASPQKIQSKEIPRRLYELYSKNDLEKLENNLTWIKVEFPQVLPADVFDDLFCSINCFPVFNRHLNEFTQSSREFINVIPLYTDEIFLDMKGVTSSSGKTFSMNTFSAMNEVETGTYIIRQGGVGRFDSRNAAELVNYLLELLRDESAAFAILGTDMISSNLKELDQTITRLENRLRESKIVKEDISYLLLKARHGEESLFIEFWTTNGNLANHIKSGENLMVYEGSDLIAESVILVTPTTGGRETMDIEQRINAYRKALLSHGRVVTTEDIKALCFEHFGDRLHKAEVKKGLQIGQSCDSGFMQTLDVFLTLSKEYNTRDHEELEFLKKDLLVKLEEQSANILPFRCFISPDQDSLVRSLV